MTSKYFQNVHIYQYSSVCFRCIPTWYIIMMHHHYILQHHLPILVPMSGFEPPTSCLWNKYSYQLSYIDIYWAYLRSYALTTYFRHFMFMTHKEVTFVLNLHQLYNCDSRLKTWTSNFWVRAKCVANYTNRLLYMWVGIWTLQSFYQKVSRFKPYWNSD